MVNLSTYYTLQQGLFQKTLFHETEMINLSVHFVLQVVLQRGNKGVENEVVEHLDIQPNHQVLEVGFGAGAGLEATLKKVEHGSGKVHGVDISEQMVIIKLSSFSWELL